MKDKQNITGNPMDCPEVLRSVGASLCSLFLARKRGEPVSVSTIIDAASQGDVEPLGLFVYMTDCGIVNVNDGYVTLSERSTQAAELLVAAVQKEKMQSAIYRDSDAVAIKS